MVDRLVSQDSEGTECFELECTESLVQARAEQVAWTQWWSSQNILARSSNISYEGCKAENRDVAKMNVAVEQ